MHSFILDILICFMKRSLLIPLVRCVLSVLLLIGVNEGKRGFLENFVSFFERDVLAKTTLVPNYQKDFLRETMNQMYP